MKNLTAVPRRLVAATMLACSTLSLSTQAQNLSIQLQDQQGDAVKGAIVEVRLAKVTTPSPEIAIIDQIGRQFVPMVQLVQAGQRMNFPNSDDVRHHVYSFSDTKQFSTPLYAGEEIEPILFDKPGIAVLGCNIHDSMIAYVYVAEWQHTAISDETGHAELTGLDQQPQMLHIWHPWLQTPDNMIEIPLNTEPGSPVTVRLATRSPESNFGFRALRQQGPR
jgi:plastocyanin